MIDKVANRSNVHTFCSVTKSKKPNHTPLFAQRPQNLHISSSDFLQKQIEGKANDTKMGTVNRQVTPSNSIN